MSRDDLDGWWDAPGGTRWKCPECKEWSDIVDWEKGEVSCEDCGSHDARCCPKCEEWFDHVHGSSRIEEETGNESR